MFVFAVDDKTAVPKLNFIQANMRNSAKLNERCSMTRSVHFIKRQINCTTRAKCERNSLDSQPAHNETVEEQEEVYRLLLATARKEEKNRRRCWPDEESTQILWNMSWLDCPARLLGRAGCIHARCYKPDGFTTLFTAPHIFQGNKFGVAHTRYVGIAISYFAIQANIPRGDAGRNPFLLFAVRRALCGGMKIRIAVL